MTRKHTVLTVLIALTAIVGIPSAFAEIQNGNYGFTQMKNANLDFNTALDQFLLKIVEIVDQVNQNTADIQQINGTIYDQPYGLESLIGNNMMDIADNTIAITELQNITVVNGTDGIDGTNGIDGAQGPAGTFALTDFYLKPTSTPVAVHNQPHEIIAFCESGDVVLNGFPSTTHAGGYATSTNEPLPGLDGWKVVFIQAWQPDTYTVTAQCMDLTP